MYDCVCGRRWNGKYRNRQSLAVDVLLTLFLSSVVIRELIEHDVLEFVVVGRLFETQWNCCLMVVKQEPGMSALASKPREENDLLPHESNPLSANFLVENNAARPTIGDRLNTGPVPKQEEDVVEGLDRLLIGDSNIYRAMLLWGQVQGPIQARDRLEHSRMHFIRQGKIKQRKKTKKKKNRSAISSGTNNQPCSPT